MSADILSKPIDSLPDFAGILRDQETFGSGKDEPTDFSDSINSAFDRLMIQSGMQIAPSLLLFLSFFAALVVGGLAFIAQENPLTASMMAGFGGVGPILAAIIIRSNRQRKMQQQLPSMIDELARAAKTGRSIQKCWEIFANVNNVFDKRYGTAAALAENPFNSAGAFQNSSANWTHETFLAPGAPRAAGIGVRFRFGKT